MITELTIAPEYGDSLTLSVPGPSDGYLVKEIEGLGPVPVAISSEVVAGIDGEVYQASHSEKRNIVIKIKLSTNFAGTSVEARRNRLQKMTLGKQNVTLLFTTVEYGEVSIEGRVEEVTSPQFDDDPSVTISFVCFSPDFISTVEEIIEGDSTDDPRVIEYTGTSVTGFYLHYWSIDATQVGLFLETYFAPTGTRTGSFKVESTGFPVSSPGWVFDTRPGQKKYFRLSDNATRLDLIDWSDFIWAKLIPGENHLILRANTPAEGMYAYKMTYNNRYGAI